ncbi:hypothetical protein ASG49_16745 [Marmoricola sp. Leaf446]|uniref:hypothetical protein n=1 Tax=Marmoricola sp. Leaf446 TaxID=1736379 RepID=UPI0006F61AB8|nr:hypothetical protein [Marmoricola sp. Leaf446]KQT89411.1 hypothetical protein ASG49_16745 [Marmoricola sp. Leaf446]
MVASRSARERKAGVEAGPLARVVVDVDRTRAFVYKISCTTCTTKGDKPWGAYRPGGDNGYLAAMDRWTFHLVERHPGTEAPCLTYLADAQQRLHERREGSAPTPSPDA